MPRPKRPRHISSRPAIDRFGPVGNESGNQIIMSLEEYEALRLIDYGKMDQSEAAQVMNVSRQTVGRILKTARFKLTTALVEGCRLKVKGGCYRIGRHPGQGRGRGGRGRNGHGKGQGGAGCGSGRIKRNQQ